MGIRLSRPRKPETSARTMMEEAFIRLRVAELTRYDYYCWDLSLPDETIRVELWGGSHLSPGEAILHSTRLGQWFAALNGPCQNRVGKPRQKFDGGTILDYLQTKGSMPQCHFPKG